MALGGGQGFALIVAEESHERGKKNPLSPNQIKEKLSIKLCTYI